MNKELTEKQALQLSACQAILDKYGIKIEVDPLDYKISQPCAIDVEHDEQGNLVCIGVYDGLSAYCFTRIDKCLVSSLQSVDIIAHNGISDFGILRGWGVDLKDNQLIWDSMLLGHILDSSLKTYGLKDMAKRELGDEWSSYDDIVGKHKGKTTKAPKCPQTEIGCCGRVTLDKQPLELTIAYNMCDTVVAYKLHEKQKKEVENYV